MVRRKAIGLLQRTPFDFRGDRKKKICKHKLPLFHLVSWLRLDTARRRLCR
ncbi:hypothetical protein [Leptolyngbya ohadii]|uniref:hypothetical protein n=1 Tax=Leptolyngbya ohadii TaxID=1962290 RepID=UPI0015C651E9|nr:hypothetical protein [Leptolyngbya ohadii]